MCAWNAYKSPYPIIFHKINEITLQIKIICSQLSARNQCALNAHFALHTCRATP